MRIFKDTETNCPVFEDDLHREFANLQAEQPDEYNYTFEQYIRNCTGKNGFLTECNESQIKGMIFGYAVSGMLPMAREIGERWNM